MVHRTRMSRAVLEKEVSRAEKMGIECKLARNLLMAGIDPKLFPILAKGKISSFLSQPSVKSKITHELLRRIQEKY